MKLINNFKLKYNNFLFLWGIAFFLNIIALSVVFFQNSLRGNNVALKYSVNTGVLWYGNGNNLLFIPAIGILVTIINYFVFVKTKNAFQFLAYSIVIANLAVQLLLLIGILFLAHIN